jgi:replicative DNA helicase
MAVDALEYQVLSSIRSRIYYLKSTRYIREELFESSETKFIYNLISNHHQEEKSDTITMRSLRILLSTQVKAGDKAKYRGLIRRIRINTVKDEAIITKIMKRFARRQVLKHAILEAIEKLDSGEEADLDRVRQRIDEAILIDTKTSEESYNYFHDPLKRNNDEGGEERIPTGLSKELDDSISGGLAAGEIGIIVAPTGVGKTLLLVNIGYGAMLRGKKVVYATLEIRPRKVARRFDCRITKTTFSQVAKEPVKVQTKLRALEARGAGLHIKDYTSALVSVPDLRAYLDRLKANKFPFDVIIVDHADLMYSPKQYKERRYELSSIVSGLRRLANEFNVPVWTASQATREAGKKGKTGLWDIAEDIGKANWADLAITLSQTDDEKTEGVMWLKVAKNRLGSTNPKVQVFIDYDTMTVKGAQKEISDVRRRLRQGTDKV